MKSRSLRGATDRGPHDVSSSATRGSTRANRLMSPCSAVGPAGTFPRHSSPKYETCGAAPGCFPTGALSSGCHRPPHRDRLPTLRDALVGEPRRAQVRVHALGRWTVAEVGDVADQARALGE